MGLVFVRGTFRSKGLDRTLHLATVSIGKTSGEVSQRSDERMLGEIGVPKAEAAG